MEPERAKNLKKVTPQLLLGLLAVESFTLPIFRSGGRTELSFWGWVKNHTIFGPPVEYVPVEDYARELQGVFPQYPVANSSLTFSSMEEAMSYFKCGETCVKQLVKNEEVSIVAGSGRIELFSDLLADVRYDKQYHSVKGLVQPDDPTVRDVARVLVQADDFSKAAQEFVNTFTTYEKEVGDYWTTPAEILEVQAGDCDDKGILLCSILRNYLPPDQVYCAFGLWSLNGDISGHMWVVTEGENGEDRVIEATAGPDRKLRGKYILHGMFNDVYAFATDIGLREFDMKTVESELAEAGGKQWLLSHEPAK